MALDLEVTLTPERLFFGSIKSERTKENYKIFLEKFCQFTGCKTINDLLLDNNNNNDIKSIENRIIQFIIRMKEKDGKNFCAIKNYVSPIISFYKINDIMVNSVKIHRFMPSKTKIKKIREFFFSLHNDLNTSNTRE